MEMNRNSPTFCILPFIHVNSSVTGDVRPCCNTHHAFSFTDREKSLVEAFHSEEMEQLRYNMNNGIRTKVCDICWDNEDAGMVSQRNANNSKFGHYDKVGLQFLDVKFDNKCNLQCRMCDPYSSDQIWKTFELLDELPGHLKHIKKTKEQYDALDNSERRKQYVLESLPDLRFLKCTGGEPLMSKHFLDVLHKAVETGHSKHITLSVTTNGTKFQRRITELFEHFEGIDINISVDGTGKVYDYIRYPFKWDNWYNRIIDFLTDMEEMNHPNFKYRFSTVVTAYNYLNLCDLQKQLDNIVGMFPLLNKQYEHVNYFDFNLKPDTSELHPKRLPVQLLKIERDKAQKLFNVKFTTHPLNSIVGFVDMCMDVLDYSKEQMHEHCEELRKSTNMIDKVRNQSYEELDPKLVRWIKHGKA